MELTQVLKRMFWSLVVLGLAPAMATAQSSITGTVRDATGAVLPGVTVEASSPVLIEKSRSAVTDGEGVYRVIDLRPGPYSVTFTLSGFSSVRREGIDLPASFTATLNADMKVGSLEETVTVSGQGPLVDVSNTASRTIVSKEVIDALPAAQHEQLQRRALVRSPEKSLVRFCHPQYLLQGKALPTRARARVGYQVGDRLDTHLP